MQTAGCVFEQVADGERLTLFFRSGTQGTGEGELNVPFHGAHFKEY